jgi:DNA-binding transcriptional MerR regulator
MGHTVGDVAKLAHVSVRTLHHYDEIGLLAPSGRSHSGYRLYTDADLERLQQILFFRELGFALDHVGRILDDRSFDRKKALVAQRALLVEKAARVDAMVRLVDKAIDALTKGTTMNRDEMFEGFGDEGTKEHEQEAKARWGNTAQHAESARRTKGYTKEDYKAIKAEGEAIEAAFAEALASGVPATDAKATAIAECARLHIDKWFYPCPKKMHAALGAMYVQDARFTEHYERRQAGLAAYVRDAILANASSG